MTNEHPVYPRARFWNKIARNYASRPVEDQAAYEHKLAVTRGYLTPEMRLLEIGCGTGATALIHAPHVAHIDAIDFSSEMISIARGKAADQGIENVNFAVSTLDTWPKVPEIGPYDAILAMSVLHLMEDLDLTLMRIRQHLSPGGLFFSSTVCLADMGWMTKYVLPIAAKLPVLPYLNAFSADELEQRMRAAGFDIEQRWQPAPKKAVFMVARAR